MKVKPKYKVGDKVCVVHKPIDVGPGWNTEMYKFLGEVVTICGILSRIYESPRYEISEDNRQCVWDERFFSGPANEIQKIKIEIDPSNPEEAHKAVEEACARFKRSKAWTDAEIQAALKVAHEELCKLFDQHTNVVFYDAGIDKIEATTRFGHPRKKERNVVANPTGGDIYNSDIGRCVCLCKLTGRKIPQFILDK